MSRRLIKGTRSLYLQHRKRLFLIAMSSIVFSVPILSYVAYALNHGYTTLEHLAENRDITTIRNMIRSARGDFERSSFLLTPFSWIPLEQVDMIHRASAGGLALTR